MESAWLGNLPFDNTYFEPATEKLPFNLFNHALNLHVKSLLCKGLNFVIPPKNLSYADYLLLIKSYTE